MPASLGRRLELPPLVSRVAEEGSARLRRQVFSFSPMEALRSSDGPFAIRYGRGRLDLAKRYDARP